MRVSLIHIIPLSSPPPPPTFFVLSSWAIQTLSQTQMWPVQDRLPNLYVQFSSVTQSCPTLCNPMNRSTTGLPVHHKLPEFTKTHVHWVSDAIQSSHPLSSTSPPAPNPSQNQSLIQWVNSLHEVAKALEFQLQHRPIHTHTYTHSHTYTYIVYMCCAQSLSHVWLFATPWTQPTRLFCPWGYSSQEYWNGVPFPTLEDPPNSGIKPESLVSPALAGGFFTTRGTWEAHIVYMPSYFLHSSQVSLMPQSILKWCSSIW